MQSRAGYLKEQAGKHSGVKHTGVKHTGNQSFVSQLLGKIGLLDDKISRGSDIETKMQDQFRYFRLEFIDICQSAGIAIPMDMMEENASRIFIFVQQKGPSHVFQVIRSNPENVGVLRSAMALLIVTFTILQAKKESSIKMPEKFSRKSSSVGSESLSTWISSSLLEICDSSVVQILIQVLKYSTTLSLDELCLNLLAKIVLVSAECAEQMLLPASYSKNQRSTTQPSVSKQTEDTRTCISYIFSVAACNKNREVIIAAVADIIIGVLLVHKQSPNLLSICEEIARTTVTVLPLQKNKANDIKCSDNRKSKDIEWAALKLLLKFIGRFQRFLAELNDEDFRNANEPSSQKVSILYAHRKVIIVISLLISNCFEVAVFVNTLVGVEAMIRKSAKLVPPDTTEANLIEECLIRLKVAREPDVDDSAKGVIVVNLLYCSNLYSDPDGGDVSDPFVSFTLGSRNAKSKRHNNEVNPIFNEVIRIPWDEVSPLIINVEDYDSPTSTEPLGDLTLDIPNFDFSQGKVLKVKDVKLNNISQGSITLNVTYKANREKAMVGRLSVFTDIAAGVKTDYAASRRRSTDVKNSFLLAGGRGQGSPSSSNGRRSQSIIRPDIFPSQLTLGTVQEDLHDSTTETLDDDDSKLICNSLTKMSKESSIDASLNQDLQEDVPTKAKKKQSNASKLIASTASSRPSSSSVRPLREAFSPSDQAERTLEPLKYFEERAKTADTGSVRSSRFFSVLKKAPSLPKILHANDILCAPDRNEFIQKSVLQSEAVSRKVMDRLKYEGGYLNGKNTISIVERAARVYNPFGIMDEKVSPLKLEIHKKDNSSVEKLQQKQESMEALEAEFNGFMLDSSLTSGDAINNFFLFPDLFEFNARGESEREGSSSEKKLAESSVTNSLVQTDVALADDALSSAVKTSSSINLQVQLPSIIQKSILESSADAVAEFDKKLDREYPTSRGGTPFMESLDFLFP